MPATTIGLFFMATYARMTRGLDARGQSGSTSSRPRRAQRAFAEAVIQRRHVLRNAFAAGGDGWQGLQAGTLVGWRRC